MSRHEEWNFFIEQLQDSAIKKYRDTPEHALRAAKQEHLHNMMVNELTEDQTVFLEEALSEIISFYDRQVNLLYQQGMKDGLWILKTLAQ